MSSQRKQATQLGPGDRFVVQTRHAFEVVRSEVDGETVTLTVRPSPCSKTCPQGCGCDASLFADQERPLRLQLPTNRRLEYLGNLSELKQVLEQTQARIQHLQAASNASTPESATDGR